jgi:Cytochrome oxidase complex assembly protein 1
MSNNIDRFEIDPRPNPTNTSQPKSKSGCLWISLGIGCFGTLILICCGFVGALFWGVTSLLQNTTPYQDAVKTAQGSPEVRKAIGDDIEPTWPVTGSIRTNNSEGEADIVIPIKGSNGSGNIHVKGVCQDSVWSYETMTFTDSHGNIIDLKMPPENTLPESADQSGFESLGN